MKKEITAVIVTIGDELLMGQTLDTNSAYLGQKLNELGINVIEVRSISDKREAILSTWEEVSKKVDLVITTGGLGPTNDDITKKVFAEFCNSELVVNKEAELWLNDFFSKVLKREMNALNRTQTLLPKLSIPLKNTIGTAPGMWTNFRDTIFVHMPGVPTEMKALFNNEVVPKLKETFDFSYILFRNVQFVNLPESTLAEQLTDFEKELPPQLSVAYLPSGKRVRLRITARGDSKEVLNELLEEAVNKVVSIVPDNIYSIKEDSLERLIGNLLKAKNLTIATAESFTSGSIAQHLTSVSGSSAYFQGGIIAYSPQQKIDLLQVDEDIINEFSTVSEQVAIQMAKGVLSKLKVDVAIASTGVAGPNSDEYGNDIGVAFIAIVTKDHQWVGEFNYPQLNRKDFTSAITKLAIENLYRFLVKFYK